MFAQRLKELRLEANLTQKELAKIIESSQQIIGLWEKGTRNPKHEAIKRLSEYFNVSTDYLLGNTDIKEVNDDIDKEELKESLRNSLGFTGQPPTEEEVENMANAFLEFMANRKSK